MSKKLAGRALYPSLKGRSVFITGGGTGIGAVMVKRFCQQGAKVTFVDIATQASDALCQYLHEQGYNDVHFIQCDIRNIDHLLQSIEKARNTCGDISILINNAADDTRHSIEEMTVEYWDDRMAVNLRPIFFCAQAIIPQMQGLGGGSIINLGSVSWRLKQTGMPAYTTAKAAIEGLSKTLAAQHGKDNIRVNTLVPGWVMTDKQMQRWLNPDIVKDIHENQCLKHTLQPDDIANTALFLASDDSNMMTAQTIIVDGGWV
ncbi:SDR family oxidoreductase [Alteromonadaceae bacterium BrNp21-10]|nr:SDR family oxidoreductase [Alteromonadaceae bacterium BrNp21-10]